MPIKPDLKWLKEAWILGQDVSAGFTSTMYTVLFPHFWLPLCALLHTTGIPKIPLDHQRKIQLKKRLKLKLLKRKRKFIMHIILVPFLLYDFGSWVWQIF
ncbi:hypothetical protein JHK85_007319 [Glycine max]|uniref:Uncharacterized protein n=2 Tax=Glycine subgen. Soja TaxID=1462606 RepID=K7KEA6_SOYBN|nr:hypothetical protein JHK87_006951 [Glycine soja]KAG5054809.1 hypothetical protein JHK85_007319 [Glycine max]KAG5071899.1 hypothetical protein JHK86_007110 [Glycine max]RZC20091.1 hypothetical protein D0Y65_006787 [Glycine soja]